MAGKNIKLPKKYWITLALIVLLACSGVLAQTTRPGLSGIFAPGLNFGAQKIYGDDPHTGFAPAGELYLRALLSQWFNLALGLGYGELSDGSRYDRHNYITNMFTGDLKGNIILVPGKKFRPYLSLGIGMHNWQFTGTPWNYIWQNRSGNDKKTERFTDIHSISGGGFELFLSPRIAFNALADYRFVLTSPADNLDDRVAGDSKDGYLNLRAGLTFYLRDQLNSQIPTDELIPELLANDAFSPFDTSESDITGKQKQAALTIKIDQLQKTDQEFTLDQYLLLQTRLEELKQQINVKTSEIDDLQTTLEQQEAQVKDLEQEFENLVSKPGSQYPSAPVATRSLGTATFSSTYEAALRQFYSFQFLQALTLFNELITSWPDHRLVSNCHYWIGEAYFAMANYAEAITAFSKVFSYPGSPKQDDATIMLAQCYIKQGDLNIAREYLEKLMREFPASEYVSRAANLLSKM